MLSLINRNSIYSLLPSSPFALVSLNFFRYVGICIRGNKSSAYLLVWLLKCRSLTESLSARRLTNASHSHSRVVTTYNAYERKVETSPQKARVDSAPGVNWRSAPSALLLTFHFRRFLTIYPVLWPVFIEKKWVFWPVFVWPLTYLTPIWTLLTYMIYLDD